MAEKKPDEELAAYYEAHKDDVSLWQSKARKIRVRRGSPSTVFALRLAPEELEQIHSAALSEGTTASAFIRDAALEKAKSLKSRS